MARTESSVGWHALSPRRAWATVTFSDGSTPLGPAQLLDGSGLATISISTLAVGPPTITASYSGDSNFITSSTPTALTQTVNQAATTTTVTSSANPSVSGQPVTFTATVKAAGRGNGTPTGTVTFSINGTPQSPVALTVINGVDQATFTTAPLSAGTDTITASYGGDSNLHHQHLAGIQPEGQVTFTKREKGRYCLLELEK